MLFNRSVYENIKYNMKEAKFEDVVEASKLAKAFDFICEGNFGLTNQKKIEEDEVTSTASVR